MTTAGTYQVTVSGRVALSATERTLLRKAVKAALRAHGVPRAKIGLRLVSDDEMATMNRKHLNHEGPTDVLTFDLREEEANADLEGEIALSVDTARREGESFGHGFEAELALYAVHGVLHLLSYRDDGKEAAAAMHVMEDQILESIGLGAIYASLRR